MCEMPGTTLFMFLLYIGHIEVWTLSCEWGQYTYNEECRECRTTCSKCISEYLCTECKTGFYGEGCTKYCSEACSNKTCLQSTGLCVSCTEGHYFSSNQMCLKCPERCKGCISEEKCTSCEIGYTGNVCGQNCRNCKPRSGCLLTTGFCIEGCNDGYTGENCLENCNEKCHSCNRNDKNDCKSCANGKYGSNCDKQCPFKCTGNSCKQDTGECSHGCDIGYWGHYCENICPHNCRQGLCVRNSSVCSEGCDKNFTGTKCLCPSKCKCDSDGLCEQCSKESAFRCDGVCSAVCVGNICSYGDERKCLYGCKDSYSSSLCGENTADQTDNREHTNIAVVGVGVSAASILATIIVIVAGLYLRKRIRRGTQAVSDDHAMASTTAQDTQIEQSYSEIYSEISQTTPYNQLGSNTRKTYFTSLSKIEEKPESYLPLQNTPGTSVEEISGQPVAARPEDEGTLVRETSSEAHTSHSHKVTGKQTVEKTRETFSPAENTTEEKCVPHSALPNASLRSSEVMEGQDIVETSSEDTSEAYLTPVYSMAASSTSNPKNPQHFCAGH